MNPLKIWQNDARRTPDTRHVDTCDGIRAFSVLMVGWFHIWQQSWLYPEVHLFGRYISLDPLVRAGYIWVDILILISGFCLYLPWARARRYGTDQPRTVDFYVRRLIRIEPSYLLAVLVMLAVAVLTGAYMSRDAMIRDLFAHLTYTHMFFFDTYYSTQLGGAMWTLAVEMQFYLLFPLLAYAFYRFPVMTFAAMSRLSLAFRGFIGLWFADVGMFFNQLPAYLDVFACGMAAAAVHVRLSECRHNAVTRLLCTAGTVLVIWALLQVNVHQAACVTTEEIRLGQMNRRLIMGLLGGSLLVLSAHAGLVLRKLLSNPVTRFVSAVSMQFYIWHQWLAVWILKIRLVPSDYEMPNYSGDLVWQKQYTFVCFALALALSALLTFGFERPVARHLQRLWKRRRR